MTPDVFAAHLLAALPLAGVVGLRLAGRPLVWAAVGAVSAAAVSSGWAELTALLDDLDAGLAARAGARTGSLVLAAVPWSAAVAGLFPAGRRPRPTGLAVGAAAVAALAVPALAADRAATTELARAARLLAAGRLVAADRSLSNVTVLTADRTLPMAGTPTRVGRVRVEVGRQVDRLRAEAGTPSPATPAGRYERAEVLLALDRPAEVVPLLRDHVAGSPRVRLRLAEALADLRDWPAAAEQCRAAAEAVRPFADRDPRAAAVRRQAVDALADALAEQGDRAGVEGALRDGADSLPAFAGHFHLRLGDFYRTTGRPLAALAELREAVRLDPSSAPQAAHIERAVRDATPGCLVGR